jgi:uncharacterized protein
MNYELIRKKEKYSLTFLGKLLLLTIIVFIIYLGIKNIYPFLSITDTVKTDVLVVEGWLPDFALKQAVEEYNSGNYKTLIVTGMPIQKGSFLTKFKTYAEVSALTMKKFGVNAGKIIKTPTPLNVLRDRTFASAFEVRNYLTETNSPITSFNIFSMACHARRSRLLFEEAFPDYFNIGIIASKDITYNSKQWWTSSKGVRTLISEAISYLYAWLFFNPTDDLISENDPDKIYKIKMQRHRDEKDIDYTDIENTPLTGELLIDFIGLKYFPIDINYKLSCSFERDTTAKPFKMKTSTDRRPDYIKYGELNFQINNIPQKLSVYQNLKLVNRSGYEDYLFIPFRDETSGNETYVGGRFIDFKIPQSDTIFLDFNLAYNPLCAYNHKYSCPIPPDENVLKVRIEAGEKSY